MTKKKLSIFQLPTSAVDVIISAGLTNYPVIGASTNAHVKNLTHNGTAKQITVSGNGKLTMNGSYTAVSGARIKVLTNI